MEEEGIWDRKGLKTRQSFNIILAKLMGNLQVNLPIGMWRNNSRKNEGMEPKQKQYPAVDVTGDRSKV